MLKLTPIPAFNDNYIWCFYDDQSKEAVVVDPGCANAVIDFLEKASLNLVGILITHHHADHTGGVDELCSRTVAKVYGFERAKFKGIQNAFSDGDHFEILGTTFTVIEVPGHTLDHIAFFSASDSSHADPWLFCGDTLFSGGCGRLFEGSAKQMHHSLGKIKQLSDETLICCAHEYTLANLRFAEFLMPNNPDLSEYHSLCREKRNKNTPTLPSTLKQEKLINPFLRESDPEIIKTLSKSANSSMTSDIEVWTEIRKAKDSF